MMTMNDAQFEALVKEIRTSSIETLLAKNANYAQNGDKLHNFRVGSAMTGETPAQIAFGYMAKHLVSLRDKVTSNDFSNLEDLKEKCQDIINYTVFLWCIGNEVHAQQKQGGMNPNVNPNTAPYGEY